MQDFPKEFGLYEGNLKCLTEPEAFALLKTPTLDEARIRIIEAGIQRNGSNNAERIRPPRNGRTTDSFEISR
ncbi:MAG: hypothetical protein LBH43_16145 [Treponema sp.]|jgi:hypothetical protein|nr:hypothetical protein [Treponema sp.]